MEKWNISPVKYYLSVFTVAMEAEVYPDIISVLLDCLCYRSRLRLRVGFRSLRRRKIVKPSLKFRHHRMKSHLVRFRAGVRGHYAQPKTKHVPVSVQIHSVATWARRWRGSRKVSVNSWPECVFFSLFFFNQTCFFATSCCQCGRTHSRRGWGEAPRTSPRRGQQRGRSPGRRWPRPRWAWRRPPACPGGTWLWRSRPTP